MSTRQSNFLSRTLFSLQQGKGFANKLRLLYLQNLFSMAIRWPGFKIVLYDQKAYPVSFLHNDQYLKAYLRVQDAPIFFEIWESKIYKGEERQSFDLIIDAGANIGMTSLFLASRYPQTRIKAIEPNPKNLILLEKNTKAYSRITICSKAITHDGRPVAFDISPLGYNSKISDNHDGDKPSITIEEIIGNASNVLLKIDIEGGEKELFEADTDWLHSVKELFIEVHSKEVRNLVISKANEANHTLQSERGSILHFISKLH